MSALSLATVTRVWAQSLADLDPVPEDKLQILQQVCKADAITDRQIKTAGALQGTCLKRWKNVMD
jgi:hypothetical protein